jgi:hypothetical protein
MGYRARCRLAARGAVHAGVWFRLLRGILTRAAPDHLLGLRDSLDGIGTHLTASPQIRAPQRHIGTKLSTDRGFDLRCGSSAQTG